MTILQKFDRLKLSLINGKSLAKKNSANTIELKDSNNDLNWL